MKFIQTIHTNLKEKIVNILKYVTTIFVVLILIGILCYAPAKITVEGLLCITLLLAVYLIIDIIYLWNKEKKDGCI